MVEALSAAAQGRALDAAAAARLDAHYEHGVRHDLYG
jgi:hypothetical protein